MLREAVFPQGAKRTPDGVGRDAGCLFELGHSTWPGFKCGEHQAFQRAHRRWLRCLPVEHDGEPDAGICVAGGREACLGDRLGHDGDSAGERLDGAGTGLGGVDVLADGDQPSVAGGRDGVLPETVDGDAVKAAGAADDEAVAAEPDLDGEPGGPGVEVAVDDRVGDQLAEGPPGAGSSAASAERSSSMYSKRTPRAIHLLYISRLPEPAFLDTRGCVPG